MLDRPEGLEQLVVAASAGDDRALHDLLAAIEPEVLRLCARFLPNRQDAEEACQDTLLAVARGLSGFDGRAAFRTWLFRVAANRSRSTYRGLRRRAAEAVGLPVPDRADP